MTYKLAFDFWSPSSLWSLPNLTVAQLVEDTSKPAPSLGDDKPITKLTNWLQQKKKKTGTNGLGTPKDPEAEITAALFVFEEAKRIIEDPSFKKKALKGLIFFREALIAIETLLQNITQIRKQLLWELRSWIDIIDQTCRRRVQETTAILEDDLNEFLATVKFVKENGHPPIDDLTSYMKDDNDKELDVHKFLPEFRKQMKHNYVNLTKLEFTQVRHHLLAHSNNIKHCLDFKLDIVFTDRRVEKLKAMYDLAVTCKDELVDLSQYLRSHWAWCKEILEPLGYEHYCENKRKISEYYNLHKDVFDKTLGCEEPPELPFTIPLLIDLREEIVEVKDDKTYEAFKKIYHTVVATNDARMAVLPKDWPVTLQNLSTYDGKPPLTIGNLDDFQEVMVAYGDFITHISELNESWNLAIRKLYEFLDLMHVFSKDKSYFNEVCYTNIRLPKFTQSHPSLLVSENPDPKSFVPPFFENSTTTTTNRTTTASTTNTTTPIINTGTPMEDSSHPMPSIPPPRPTNLALNSLKGQQRRHTFDASPISGSVSAPLFLVNPSRMKKSLNRSSRGEKGRDKEKGKEKNQQENELQEMDEGKEPKHGKWTKSCSPRETYKSPLTPTTKRHTRTGTEESWRTTSSPNTNTDTLNGTKNTSIDRGTEMRWSGRNGRRSIRLGKSGSDAKGEGKSDDSGKNEGKGDEKSGPSIRVSRKKMSDDKEEKGSSKGTSKSDGSVNSKRGEKSVPPSFRLSRKQPDPKGPDAPQSPNDQNMNENENDNDNVNTTANGDAPPPKPKADRIEDNEGQSGSLVPSFRSLSKPRSSSLQQSSSTK